MCPHSLNLSVLLDFAGVENSGVLSISPGLLAQLARSEFMASPLTVSRLYSGVMIVGVSLDGWETHVK